jgi:hypothetical protein
VNKFFLDKVNYSDFVIFLPDNATRSVVSRLTAENLDVVLARVSNGEGMELLAPA